MTSSIRPYALASSAVNQRSRSESCSICSTVCPEWNAIRSYTVRFTYRMLSAWIAMSAVVPPIPPDGWCIMMRACGSA